MHIIRYLVAEILAGDFTGSRNSDMCDPNWKHDSSQSARATLSYIFSLFDRPTADVHSRQLDLNFL